MRHASAIVAHFYHAKKRGEQVHPDVLKYIARARLRYSSDPKPNIAKALWLVQSRRGNPNEPRRSKRRLIAEGRLELGQEVCHAHQGGRVIRGHRL